LDIQDPKKEQNDVLEESQALENDNVPIENDEFNIFDINN
jgi:hypothetical protein